MNLMYRHVLQLRTFRLCERFAPKIFPIPIKSCSVIESRKYCDDRTGSPTLPRLMEFPPVVWPSLIKFMKNWVFSLFIIKPYFDQDFSLNEFIEASKHAVQVVSECLKDNDFQALEGLVEKDAITALKNAVSRLSVTQRQLLAVNKDDIFYAFPYQVGVMFDNSDKRWVEITMCYHVLKGLKKIQETGDVPLISIGLHPEYKDRMYVLNYRFIKEFTKGVEDSWWVNVVNHFQLEAIAKKSY